MSRNSLLLEKAVSAAPALLKAVPRSVEYRELIRRLCPSRSVVAIVAGHSGSRGPAACRGIAAELAASGRRVVIVQVDALLRTSPLPDASACAPGRVPNVFLWPAASAAPVEFFPSSPPAAPSGDWLGSLRRAFDAVLLDCPSPETTPAAAEIAALADSAVLVVEAGRTTRRQIQISRQALDSRGVKLVGSILMRQR
jgi:Mrp family chromosome partitioning ATPase